MRDGLSRESGGEGMLQWVPSVCGLLLLLVLHGAVGLVHPAMSLPDIVVQLVIFWGWYRPAALPAVAVLVLGVVQDSLTGFPLGMHASMLLVLQLVMRSRVRSFAEQRFAVQWLVASAIMGALMLVRGLLYEAYVGTHYMSWGVVQGWALTVLTYPLLHWCCAALYSLGMHSSGPRGRTGRS
jgi:rod shape-determining protein MreD